MSKLFEVTVETTYTKKYYIDCTTEEEAREKYYLEGNTSALYETQKDRKIIDVQWEGKGEQ